MFGWRRSMVYCSKDKEDWEKAKRLLEEVHVPMEAWHAEEAPIAGCGCKVDIRNFASRKPFPKELYKIEVVPADRSRAEAVLRGKVRPVRFYGVG